MMQDFLSNLQGSGLMGFYIAAFILGAFHALEPGHGKTVVAAYLVGSKAKVYEAILLGIIVTFTHTFSIIILAILTNFAAKTFPGLQLHIYLGFVAAALIISVGVSMIWTRFRALRRRIHSDHEHVHEHGDAHAHDHEHDHDHDHEHSHEDIHEHAHDGHVHEHGDAHTHDHDHEHEHAHSHGGRYHTHYAPKPGEETSLWKLLFLGISGGIVPCPAAFWLLLAAVSTGHVAKGLSIVIVFSLGLAVALIAIGISVVKTAGFAGRFMDMEKAAPYISLASAVLVTLIGVATLYGSTMHVIHPIPPVVKPG